MNTKSHKKILTAYGEYSIEELRVDIKELYPHATAEAIAASIKILNEGKIPVTLIVSHDPRSKTSRIGKCCTDCGKKWHDLRVPIEVQELLPCTGRLVCSHWLSKYIKVEISNLKKFQREVIIR